MSTSMDMGDYVFFMMSYGGASYCFIIAMYLLADEMKSFSKKKNFSFAIYSMFVAALHSLLFILDESLRDNGLLKLLKNYWLWLHIAPASFLLLGFLLNPSATKKTFLIFTVNAFWMFSIGLGFFLMNGK